MLWELTTIVVWELRFHVMLFPQQPYSVAFVGKFSREAQLTKLKKIHILVLLHTQLSVLDYAGVWFFYELMNVRKELCFYDT